MSTISLLGDCQVALPLAIFLGQENQYTNVRIVGSISPQNLSIAQDCLANSGSYTNLDQCQSGASLNSSDIIIICSSLHKTSLSFPLDPFINRINSNAKILVVGRSVCRLSADISKMIGGSACRILGIPATGSAYLRRHIANQIGVATEDITTFTIGNDQEVQIIPQYCRVNGIPIQHFLSNSQINEIISLKRIPISIDLIKVSLSQVVDAIIQDKKRLLTVASSTHTTHHIFLRLPTRIGQTGAESTFPLDLEPQQLEKFTRLVTNCVVSQI